MKKILLAAIIMLAALGSYAQEPQNHSIQVSGITKIDREVESYVLDFAVAVEYGENESRKSFEELKKSFFAKAKAAGLEESRFKEDKLGYLALQLFREGAQYKFEARSQDELLKAGQLANGTVITVTSTRVKFKPAQRDEKRYEAAFRNSREKADIIAKAINKKLGAVLTVTDLTPQEVNVDESFYFKPIADQYLYLSVTFAIE